MIRLSSLKLTDFKNVKSGSIKLSDIPSERPERIGSSVTGVYGQNGSGKTSLIDALGIIKDLWLGVSLGSQVNDCIAQGKDALTIECTFYIDDVLAAKNRQMLVNYAVKIARAEKTPKITMEKLSFKDIGSGEPIRVCFSFDSDNEKIPRPASFWAPLLPANSAYRLDFVVASAMSLDHACSLLFSFDFIEVVNKRNTDLIEKMTEEKNAVSLKRVSRAQLLESVLLKCKSFAMNDFAVISLSHHALTSLGLLNMITHEDAKISRSGAIFHLSLSSPQKVTNKEYDAIVHTIKTINKALGALVPGLSLEIRCISEIVLDNGDPGRTVELLSRRGEISIPFRCESEGIKKIVAILVALIDVFSNPSACVAVDELDSGVFEFLLGEILEVIDTRGQGQLIFTAHNLIPLEILSDKSIVFTTSNPENRYITFKGHKRTNNLRDQYLRAINLGGQSEVIYEHTSRYEIDNAFYRAGKSLRNMDLSRGEHF